MGYAKQFSVGYKGTTSIDRVVMIRQSAVTHSLHTDAREIVLVITSSLAGSVTCTSPPDPSIAVPGQPCCRATCIGTVHTRPHLWQHPLHLTCSAELCCPKQVWKLMCLVWRRLGVSLQTLPLSGMHLASSLHQVNSAAVSGRAGAAAAPLAASPAPHSLVPALMCQVLAAVGLLVLVQYMLEALDYQDEPSLQNIA